MVKTAITRGQRGIKGNPGKNGSSYDPVIYEKLGEIGGKLDQMIKNCNERLNSCNKTNEGLCKRLDSLDSPESGAVPKLQQEVTSVTTKVLTYGGLLSGGIVVAGIILHFLR